MIKNIYIFRHGETDLNNQGIRQGQSHDVPLNETGKAQGRYLAEHMKNIQLDVIFSSPLQRAHQTALIVANDACLSVIKDDRLNSIDYGIMEGELKSATPPEMLKIHKSGDLSFSFPGGEIKRDAQSRILSFIKELENTEYNSIGIATHGGIIKLLLTYFDRPINKSIPQGTYFHLQLADGDLHLISYS